MVKIPSIKTLKLEIAREKSKIRSINQRQQLSMELKKLKKSGKNDFTSRIGRGFGRLSKKAGTVALKQARAIRKRQIEESKERKKKGFGGMEDTFAPLDF